MTQTLERRGVDGAVSTNISELIKKTNNTQQELDSLRHKRKSGSKEIGILMSKGEKKSAETKKKEIENLGKKITIKESEYNSFSDQLQEIMEGLPNWIHKDVPDGLDESANQEIKQFGKKPDFDFNPKTHYDIGETMGVLDFNGGVKLAGSRFYSYKGLAAQIERALLNFMLDTHIANGYTEHFVPMLITDEGMFTTGQFPKFKGEYYNLERDGLNLIPTAEVPLVNLYRDEIILEDELPIAMTAATSCFRREAGAAGKDTRGLVRVHQFQKVELVQLVHPDESEKIHTQMLGHAENILQQLGLHYRVILLCAGDMGATATKTFDIEVWMPGLDRWLEISSVSNCLDYQARRGKIRIKSKEKQSRTTYLHTLNGSGLAAGRCLAAIMENFQTSTGEFTIPEILNKYIRR